MYPHNPYSAEKEIEAIASAIEKCGRSMVLSLSPGPAVIEKAWHLRKYANMWRITDDFWDEWRLLKAMFERCEVWQKQVSEGCWPDCDMLPLGMLGKGFADERKTRFTKDEQKTMMTLWSIFRSPLMIGAELTLLDEETRTLLTNKEVLDLLKNSTNASQIFRDEDSCVWKSESSRDNAVFVALFNLSDREGEVSVKISDLGFSRTIQVRDLWAQKKMAPVEETLSQKIPPHGAMLFKLEQ